MKRITAVLAVTAVIIAALGGDVAVAQTPRPVVRYLFRTAGLPMSGPYEVAQLINAYEPGASTPWHTHPGLVLATVLDGQITLRMGNTETVYKEGDNFVERPGDVMQATNRTGNPTNILATFMLPKNAPLSTPQPGDTTPPPRPVGRYPFRTAGLPLNGPYDVAHFINEFEPGAATPWHTHPGLVLVTVIAGELTFRVDHSEKVYKAGDSFVELPHHVAQARNASGARTTAVATFLVPRGAPLSEPVTPSAAAPAPAPATGGAMPQPGALPATGTERRHLPVLVLATVLLLGGITARRQRMRGSVQAARAPRPRSGA